VNLSVIIPARNEEHNLPPLLKSLNMEKRKHPFEIIVVDDNSTDQTYKTAWAEGAAVLAVKDKPSDWTGKNYACWYGAQHARGDTLLFMDADLQVSRGGVVKVIHEYRKRKTPLTIQPFHGMNKSYEWWSLFFNIMIVTGVGAFTLLGKKIKPSGGFGPFLLIDREYYFSIGGHKLTKESILETLTMGKAMENTLECYIGKGTVSFQMYPNGFKELWEGWTKAFIDGASQTKPLVLTMSIFWLSGLIAAPLYTAGIYLLSEPLLFRYSFITIGIAVLQLSHIGKRIGNYNTIVFLLYPIYLIFFFTLFFWSFFSVRILHRVTWKGRVIQRS
jgi:4,4'-diaponeurosporenoate glycosyltransferase